MAVSYAVVVVDSCCWQLVEVVAAILCVHDTVESVCAAIVAIAVAAAHLCDSRCCKVCGVTTLLENPCDLDIHLDQHKQTSGSNHTWEKRMLH